MTNLKLEQDGGIVVVTLDRPPVNALDGPTFAEIGDVFESFAHDRSVRVAVLAAAGTRAFCAGVDLDDSPRRQRPDGRREDGGPQGDAADQVDYGLVVRRCFWGIYDCAVPVIAAVDAPAIGAGLALAASCDLLVASERATFSLREIAVGVLGGARHAQRLLGPYMAKRMFLTGDSIPAAEVHRLGGAEPVVPAGEALPAALALAGRIAGHSPIAVRLAKESANRVEPLPLKEGYRLEQDYTLRVGRYADAAEARRAFFEKRDPEFQWE
jgi:enoyl-CoA hydratase/carnithine racemase